MTPALAAGPHLAAGAHAFPSLQTAGPITTWVIVLTFVFLECSFLIGLFLPGDSLLIAAGVVLAQHHHHAGVYALAAAATVVAVLGNLLGFLIGRQTGNRIVARKDGKILNRHNLDRAARFFHRRGFWAVVVARWIPWVRTLAPVIAGAARMELRKYVAATTIGALVWVPTLLLSGYYGAHLLDGLPWAKHVVTWISVAGVFVGAIYGYIRYRQEVRKPVDPAAGPLEEEVQVAR